MNDCPVAIVDHESSLIAADWYEEHGQLEIAEQIRFNEMLTQSNAVQGRQKSRCHTIRQRIGFSVARSFREHLFASLCKAKHRKGKFSNSSYKPNYPVTSGSSAKTGLR